MKAPLPIPLDEPSPAFEATARARAQMARGLEPELARLRRLDGWKRSFELGVFFFLWAAGSALALTGWELTAVGWRYTLLAVGMVCSVVAINAFVLLLHEGMHDLLFARPALNRWVSVALGSTFLMSFTAYRVLHTRHHVFLGDPRDPDDYHNYTRRPWVIWSMQLLRLTLGGPLYILAIPGLALKHGTPQERSRVLVEYAVLGLVWTAAALFVPTHVLWIVWLVPMLLVGVILPIRGLTQHAVADTSDPFLASRTIIPHPVVAFCLLNENYHLEHHLFPEIPSYHLPDLHRLIWPRLPHAVTGTSYLGFVGKFLQATSRMDETPIGLTKLNETAPVPPSGPAA